jgi:hypothetical protein
MKEALEGLLGVKRMNSLSAEVYARKPGRLRSPWRQHGGETVHPEVRSRAPGRANFLILLVEPGGIEPPTSSMPLYGIQIFHYLPDLDGYC